MYKVFVNDHLIILGNHLSIDNECVEIFNFEAKDLPMLLNRLFENSDQKRCIFLKTNNLAGDWQRFQSNFEKIEAAGGKVLNDKGEVLFIFRNQKWDLPKGKLEKGEAIPDCALREVEEECGINDLKINAELPQTFHIYSEKNTWMLKTTHWFLMETSYSGQLKPQAEEGIEAAVFKNQQEVSQALKNTYENIKLLF